GITLPLVHPIVKPGYVGFYLHAFGFGGKGIRTPGLLIANETLYQLSYTPVWERVDSYIRRRFFASWIWFQSKVQRARPDFKVSDCRSVAARHKNIQTEMLRGRL